MDVGVGERFKGVVLEDTFLEDRAGERCKEVGEGDTILEDRAGERCKEVGEGDTILEDRAGERFKEVVVGEACTGVVVREACTGVVVREACTGVVVGEACTGVVVGEACTGVVAGETFKGLGTGLVGEPGVRGNISGVMGVTCTGVVMGESCTGGVRGETPAGLMLGETGSGATVGDTIKVTLVGDILTWAISVSSGAPEPRLGWDDRVFTGLEVCTGAVFNGALKRGSSSTTGWLSGTLTPTGSLPLRSENRTRLFFRLAAVATTPFVLSVLTSLNMLCRLYPSFLWGSSSSPFSLSRASDWSNWSPDP
ncbi:hypothetical protein J4Q44_G00312960 [Coregonus suidteri]|uniref:Uncharacterized protein n=1 Tax=Coregonus suidteri TaxID=861788 RepID=A0AAN8L3M7_9TELE